MMTIFAWMALAAAQPADAGPPYAVDMVPPAAVEGSPLRQPAEEGYRCSAGIGDCLRIGMAADGSLQLEPFDMDAGTVAALPTLVLPEHVRDDRMAATIWDSAFRIANPPGAPADMRSYIIGIIRSVQYNDARGYAASSRLHLFRVQLSDGAASISDELLSLPWLSESQSYACGADGESERRGGQCHNILRFSPSLTLDPAADPSVPDGNPPALLFMANATAFPRTARPGGDPAARPQGAADMVELRDDTCSVVRHFAMNPLTGRYEADQSVAAACAGYWR